MEIAQRVSNHEPPRKRFKATELPLTQQQRSTVDALLHTFKKKGEFDALRKQAYSSFEDGTVKVRFITELTTLAENELERNNALLGKDRRQAAPLIEGAAERSKVYRTAEEDVERIIEDCLTGAEDRLREIRRKDIGDAAANEELRKGSKSDREYAEDSAARRRVWAQQREEEMERQRLHDLEEKKRLEEERRKKQAEEEEKERLKAIEREEERKKQEAWEKELEERRERKKRQDAEWEKERLEREAKERKKREAEREKEIEAAALEELIREGKRAAARAGRGDSPAREPAKTSGSKESALAAIMRKEQLERERAAKVDSRAASSPLVEEDTMEVERHKSVSASGAGTPHGGLVLRSTSSAVWVRDGTRKSRPSYGAAVSSATPTGPAEYVSAHKYENAGGRDSRSHHHEYADRRDYYDREPSKETSRPRDPHDDVGYEIPKAPRSSTRERPADESPYHEKKYGAPVDHHDRPAEEYDHGYDYERPRQSRRSERERSRSPEYRSHRHSRGDYRDRSRSVEKPRRRERSRDPKDIDRYVPGGGSSRTRDSDGKDYERKHHEHKSYDRGDHDHKDYDRKNYNREDYDRKGHDRKDYDREGYDYKEHDRKEYDRKDYGHKDHHHRESEHKSYDRRAEYRSKPTRDADGEKKKPVEIDSYIPPTSIRARGRGGRVRDEGRDERRKDGEKERESRHMSRSRSRGAGDEKARSRSRVS